MARLRRLGEVLGRLGGDSGPSWAVLGRLGDVLEPLKGRLGAAWAVLGPLGGRLGDVSELLGPSWGPRRLLERFVGHLATLLFLIMFSVPVWIGFCQVSTPT